MSPTPKEVVEVGDKFHQKTVPNPCPFAWHVQNHKKYAFYYMQFPSFNPPLFAYQRWHKKDTCTLSSSEHKRHQKSSCILHTWTKILNQVYICLLANESPIISIKKGYTTRYAQSPVLNLLHLKCCSPLSHWSKKEQLTRPISWNLETPSYDATRYFYFKIKSGKVNSLLQQYLTGEKELPQDVIKKKEKKGYLGIYMNWKRNRRKFNSW